LGSTRSEAETQRFRLRDGVGGGLEDREREPRSDQPKRFFLLDGHILSYRAYFALPSSLATSRAR